METLLKFRLLSAHAEFFSTLQLLHVERHDRDFLFVHAGIPLAGLTMPTIESVITESLANPNDILWTREPDYFQKSPSFPGLIFHGHTPLQTMPQYCSDASAWADGPCEVAGKWNLDMGCFAGGSLAALKLPECELVFAQGLE